MLSTKIVHVSWYIFALDMPRALGTYLLRTTKVCKQEPRNLETSFFSLVSNELFVSLATFFWLKSYHCLWLRKMAYVFILNWWFQLANDMGSRGMGQTGSNRRVCNMKINIVVLFIAYCIIESRTYVNVNFHLQNSGTLVTMNKSKWLIKHILCLWVHLRF